MAATVVTGLGGVASASSDGDTGYVPPGKLVAGVTTEWLPGGSFLSGDVDAQTAWGVSGWFGWEAVDRIELGISPRYIAHVAPVGDTYAGKEVDLEARIAFHTRPYRKLDLAFLAAGGFSWVHLAPEEMYVVADPSGPVGELGVSAAYPVGNGLWGVASLGYERGFQTTPYTSGGLIKTTEDTDFSTAFFHLGIGLAYRF